MDPVIQAETSSKQFVSFFYKHFDSDRNMLGSLYTPESTILWNGNPANGAQEYAQLLTQIPPTQHEVEGIDCQPIAATTNVHGNTGIMVLVTGKVKYDADPIKRIFSHSFVLMPDDKQANNYYILSENFRFV